MADELTQAGLLERLEQERTAMLELLPQFSDDQWRTHARTDGWTVHDVVTHVADSTYGLALMVLGEAKPTLPLNQQTGWMQVDEFNEERRQKNATLPREKVMSRVNGAFDTARRAIEASSDLAGSGPLGAQHSKADWLLRIIHHSRDHRRELEQLRG